MPRTRPQPPRARPRRYAGAASLLAMVLASPLLAIPAGATESLAEPQQLTAAGDLARAAADAEDFQGGELVPMAPSRLFDSRIGLGRPGTAALAAGSVTTVQVTGVGGVPVDGVGAAVVNLTATGASAPGYATLFDCDEGVPTASNVNIAPGETVANQVLVPLNTPGQACLFVASSPAHVVIDVAGWYTDGDSTAYGDRLHPVDPVRVRDTRTQDGAVGAGASIVVPLGGVVVPPTATAVILNVTAVTPTAETYVVAYPSNGARPGATSLTVMGGQTRAAHVTAVLSPDGKVALTNAAGSVHLVVDVLGYYEPSADHTTLAGRVLALSPERILDTRDDAHGPLRAGWAAILDFSRLEAALAPDHVAALIVNVTATDSTAETFVAAYPGDRAWPGTSNLYVVPGQTVPNLTLQRLGADHTTKLLSGAGTVHAIEDIQGIVFG